MNADLSTEIANKGWFRLASKINKKIEFGELYGKQALLMVRVWGFGEWGKLIPFTVAATRHPVPNPGAGDNGEGMKKQKCLLPEPNDDECLPGEYFGS